MESLGNVTYAFNGIGDYMVVPNSASLNPTGAITISLWFKPVDFLGSGYDALVLKPFTNHTAPYYQYIVGLAGNYGVTPYKFAFNANVNGINRGVFTEPDIWIAGQWYHLVGMFDGHQLKLYVNGDLKQTFTAEGTINEYNTDLYFAKQANTGSTTPGNIGCKNL